MPARAWSASGAYPVQPVGKPPSRIADSSTKPASTVSHIVSASIARERHPPRADHERHEVVAERAEHARRHHHQHHRAVQADERQVVAGLDEGRVVARQLAADEHRVEPGDEEEEQHRDEVLDRDDLVVGAEAEVAPRRRAPRARAASAGGPMMRPERVAEEAEPGDPAERREAEPHEDRDVVLVGRGLLAASWRRSSCRASGRARSRRSPSAIAQSTL